ncbi:MAG: NAD(P)/FAD-dependent oxidoreductase [Pseudaminobacter sp.]|nr:NAD(P)/FAD-dependent oxidoreductase [Pseudaminobacter sp.]
MNGSAFDCLIVGGGPAGLSAAAYLARFRRKVMVIDDRRSRARWISSVRNYPGFPQGISGQQLLANIYAQASQHGAIVQPGTVLELRHDETGFVAATDAERFTAACVLLATGVEDNFPRTPGFSEQAILNDRIRLCPVCDAYEFIDQRIGVWGHADRAVKEALFLRPYSSRITVIAAGARTVGDAERKLADAGIAIVESEVVRVEHSKDDIALIHGNGSASRFDGVYLAMGSQARSPLAIGLGAEINDAGCLIVDAHQETTAPGLYSAGDVVDELNQISVAIGHAAIAATAIHNRLAEQFQERS